MSISYISEHPFLQTKIPYHYCYLPQCQSPISRNTHFYRDTSFEYIFWIKICVNLLYLGTPISTAPGSDDHDSDTVCQSPISRNTHFYLIEGMVPMLYLCHVSISYISEHPFLLFKRLVANLLKSVCQSPISRNTHFYTYKYSWYRRRSQCVNLLYLGTPISTGLNLIWSLITLKLRVNLLYLGTPISTC